MRRARARAGGMRAAMAIALLALALAAGAITLAPITASAAAAAPRVKLHAGFKPDRAGASTTISFGFTVAQPAPVRGIEVDLPAGMGFATATLGFATCKPAVFEARGASGCPADSRVGRGTAYAEAPFLDAESRLKPTFETAKLETFFGPIEGDAQIVLFWLEGSWPSIYSEPLIARAVATPPTYGERLTLEVPLLLAAPEGPYVDLRGFETTIGPEHITYYIHRHGRAIPFKPRGLSVPERCPRGGYPVRASFTWWEGGEASHALTRVPCAGRQRRARRRRH
jgi:hypothetical protein